MTSARIMMTACALSLWSGALLAQSPATVDYDTFWLQSREAQIATFGRLTPENKADLVRTQIQRWTDANRARLSPEQLQFMAEALTFISGDLYRKPTPDAIATKSKEFEARALTLFAREDVAAAFT